MPTYDYRCKACGHTWELFQSMSAKHEKKCPKCGKATAERLIGMGAAIVFKGGGFYQTDYRSEGYKQAAEADKKASTPSTPTPSATDTKPESKPSETKGSEAKAARESKPAEAKASSDKGTSKPAQKTSGRGKRKE